MKRWDITTMLEMGTKLFAKLYQAKRHAHPNHDIHFMARDMSWLTEGLQTLINGHYDPRCLKRYYFSDERVDQLHLSDRIFQHILLQIIKPTFKYVMNPCCYHLAGPAGVKHATQAIREAIKLKKPQYFIRADIESFYKSILHYKLIQDIKQYYHDPKLIVMLQNIITNPIDTPYGYKNPDNGIALRGPLSQFFSALYLKPLDDAFDKMKVTYVRFQDDVLVLCQTKRQLNRAKRCMMQVLHERHLKLSRRKTRLGSVDLGFHFLGIHYPPTQPADNITVTPPKSVHKLNDGGGKARFAQSTDGFSAIVPHPRTLRKAREQVKCMVTDKVSLSKIKQYLVRWSRWWANTAGCWDYTSIIHWLTQSWWSKSWASTVAKLFHREITESHTEEAGSSQDCTV